MAGDYVFFKTRNRNKTVSRTVLAADTSAEHADVIAPKSALHTIYIQRISFAPTTYAAQTLTFRDGAGTPVVIGHMSIPAAAPTTGVCQYVIDFGPEGTPLTIGEELDVIFSAAGPAGRLVIEAYETGPSVAAVGSTN